MVIVLAFSMLVTPAQPGCSPEAMMAVDRAAVLAAEFDLAGAAAQLETDSVSGCEPAQIGIRYAWGLLAAQESFRQGGSLESLAPVRQAIAGLEVISKGRPGSAAHLATTNNDATTLTCTTPVRTIHAARDSRAADARRGP